MYQIYADDTTLIYDDTREDYKINKGAITLELDKSGSFSFSVYPEHPYYDSFVRMRTVITVYKSGRIVFRGRVLSDVTDYWNNKVVTCEGELGFLQDSIIRPFEFSGTPAELFEELITRHNAQVDEFKQFTIGSCTIVDNNNYIARSNESYETTFSNLTSRLTESELGGHFYITHGENGDDPVPTIHYLAEFIHEATQGIEFGENLKDYAKTVKGEDIITALIPLGAPVTADNTPPEQRGRPLTIASVNGGSDYIFDQTAVVFRGWVFGTATWDDVTVPETLKAKGEAYLAASVNEAVTLELTAIDLHLLDRSIESFRVCDLVRVRSAPHNFEATMLCNKQTMDLLKPENDTIILGATYKTASDLQVSEQKVIRKTYSEILKSNEQVKVEVKNEIEELSSEMTVEFDGIELAVQQQGERISGLEISNEEITTEVGYLGADVTSMSQRVDGLSLSIQNVDGELMLVQATIDGVTVTGPGGETLIAGGAIETETLVLSNLIATDGGSSYIQITGEGLVLYNDADEAKVRLGFTSADQESPFIQLGADGEDDYAGLFKKFTNGLWIGNAAPMEDQGEFVAKAGYNGIFINIEENVVYVVSGTTMTNLYTGNAIAKFA